MGRIPGRIVDEVLIASDAAPIRIRKQVQRMAPRPRRDAPPGRATNTSIHGH
jgi:hypothetical protein